MSEAAPVDAGKKPLWKNPFAIGFAIGVVCLTALPFLQRPFLNAPAPLYGLGGWQLVDEWGKPFGSADLAGHVWIASFFFSRCPSVCPAQQQAMGKILPHIEDLGDEPDEKGIMLVSFSVDPEYDQPFVLNAYKRKLAGPASWKFITGTPTDVKALLIDKMKVPVGERTVVAAGKDGQPDIIDIAHMNKFALIDQNGDVRGFWDTDESARGNLINAARLLTRYGPRP